ncbi:hypothetical protein [Deinococcus ruber]|uniref:Uncharacterized protein n=1 Tax=Deinococcus ruber TaxID=1848197 RepID=A0A918F717_9DEIO|nr:hypothetical protein [Deinococcus ruber]GGR11364.1 hypothetical protein GCM10008957_25130 [Deinococcus ruber]
MPLILSLPEAQASAVFSATIFDGALTSAQFTASTQAPGLVSAVFTVQIQEVTDGSATFSATTAPAVGARATFYARKPVEVRASAVFHSHSQRIVGSGASGRAVSYEVDIQGLPGTVEKWDYSLIGRYEELSVTVIGQFGLDTPAVSLHAKAYSEPGHALIGELPERDFQRIGLEPEVNIGEDTTVFHFRNSFDSPLRGVRLPELVPWKLFPTPDPCLRTHQSLSIGGLVADVMRNNVDHAFALLDDPLENAFYEEGVNDFSTEGMTPEGLWDATYGALGMVLRVEPSGTGIRLIGAWPNPTGLPTGPELSADWQLSRSQGRELLQTPSRLTIKSSDGRFHVGTADILTWLIADPALEEVKQELSLDQSWTDPAESSGTSRVQRKYQKTTGQLTATAELTTADIEVKESGDNAGSVIWHGVVTGHTQTITNYDPDCPTRPVLQRTVTRAWGFDLHTKPNVGSLDGPDGGWNYVTTGDLTADEQTITIYRYSPQGFLSAKITLTRRLASMQQNNADAAPDQRGSLASHEYITTIQTETWRPTGGGQWLYSPGVSGQTLMPVYDQNSGDAVRTASVNRSVPDAPRLTDQAPPSYPCSTCDQDGRMVNVPAGITLDIGDAGFGDAQEINLSFLPPSFLTGLSTKLLTQRWGRITTALSLPFPCAFYPGTELADGTVRELKISGTADSVDSSVTLARLDDLFGPPVASATDTLTDPFRGRAIMLSGQPGGARVKLLRGWNVASGTPVLEDAFVAFWTGFPPRPGNEIEWEMQSGIREAKNAR